MSKAEELRKRLRLYREGISWAPGPLDEVEDLLSVALAEARLDGEKKGARETIRHIKRMVRKAAKVPDPYEMVVTLMDALREKNGSPIE